MRFTLLGNVRVGNLVYWGYVCVWTILNQHKLENSRRRSPVRKTDTKNLREASQISRFLVKNKSNLSNEVIIIGLPPSSREDPLEQWGFGGFSIDFSQRAWIPNASTFITCIYNSLQLSSFPIYKNGYGNFFPVQIQKPKMYLLSRFIGFSCIIF